jgi:hypothetical protein
VEDGADGLPEITLTLSPNSAGNSTDGFVPLKFSTATATDDSPMHVSWMQNGVTADDLKTLGLNELAFPSTIAVSMLSTVECAETGAWLQSHTGRSFIVCLCIPAVVAENSENESGVGTVLSTVELNRPVAARIMASGISASGDVRICLQPCVLITSTAVLSLSARTPLNRYIYSVRLGD